MLRHVAVVLALLVAVAAAVPVSTGVQEIHLKFDENVGQSLFRDASGHARNGKCSMGGTGKCPASGQSGMSLRAAHFGKGCTITYNKAFDTSNSGSTAHIADCNTPGTDVSNPCRNKHNEKAHRGFDDRDRRVRETATCGSTVTFPPVHIKDGTVMLWYKEDGGNARTTNLPNDNSGTHTCSQYYTSGSCNGATFTGQGHPTDTISPINAGRACEWVVCSSFTTWCSTAGVVNNLADDTGFGGQIASGRNPNCQNHVECNHRSPYCKWTGTPSAGSCGNDHAYPVDHDGVGAHATQSGVCMVRRHNPGTRGWDDGQQHNTMQTHKAHNEVLWRHTQDNGWDLSLVGGDSLFIGRLSGSYWGGFWCGKWHVARPGMDKRQLTHKGPAGDSPIFRSGDSWGGWDHLGWHHLSVVFSGSTALLYVDGHRLLVFPNAGECQKQVSFLGKRTVRYAEQAGHRETEFTNVARPRESGNAGVNSQLQHMGWSINYFHGLIDDFRVYNKALSSTQITGIMNNS